MEGREKVVDKHTWGLLTRLNLFSEFEGRGSVRISIKVNEFIYPEVFPIQEPVSSPSVLGSSTPLSRIPIHDLELEQDEETRRRKKVR